MKHLCVVLLAGYSACVPCDSEVARTGLAPRSQYNTEIDACITKHTCALLCRDVFALDLSIVIEHCGVTAVEPTVAHVDVRYYDPNTCSGDDGAIDISSDDGSYDDGSDDGSTDDGSTDDGSTDDGTGSDDSGSDSGSDSGDSGGDPGGDSGGDGGSPRVQRGSSVMPAVEGAR